jgi:methylenetetrahydrofolate dehydrogenase (NADP+)/methenyltetrahydrofolate cyclohydrolase
MRSFANVIFSNESFRARAVTARLLDGKHLAQSWRLEIRDEIERRRREGLRPPALAVVQVGRHPASDVYVRHKRAACAEVGMRSVDLDLSAEISQDALLEQIEALNRDDTVDGILVQLPLPEHIDPNAVIDRIRPDKDVDGFHPLNLGLLAQRRPRLRPCTPAGVMRLLAATGEVLRGKEAVVVGASNIVGRPMALELLHAACTVTVCHSATRDLAAHVSRAEILVAAAGRPGLIRGEWIRPGAIVIDVGINRLPDGRLCGDVEFEAASERAAWITPVPGGVGPMTVASLLANTLEAAKARERGASRRAQGNGNMGT